MFLSQVNMKNSPNDWFTSVLFTKHYVKLSKKKKKYIDARILKNKASKTDSNMAKMWNYQTRGF